MRKTLLDYEIVTKNGKKQLKLYDPPQYLDDQDLWRWMKDTRDEDVDLHALLVKIYFQLKKRPLSKFPTCRKF